MMEKKNIGSGKLFKKMCFTSGNSEKRGEIKIRLKKPRHWKHWFMQSGYHQLMEELRENRS